MAESWEEEEGSAITTGGGRRASEMYVRELAMDRWRQVLEDPSYALSQDPETWRRIQRDARFAFLIQARRRKTASSGWRIVPASDFEPDKLAAGIVEQALKEIPRFWSLRYNLAEADFRGSAYAAITGHLKPWAPLMGESSKGTLYKPATQEWWMFGKLCHVDRYRFRTKPHHDKPWERQLFSPARNAWEPLDHPEWFVRHLYEDSEGSRGFGAGLLDPLYFIWYTKMACLELGLQGVEAWANGRLEVAVDGLRAPSGETNQAVVNAWKSTVRSWLRDHVLVHDERDNATMHDGPTQGHNMAVDFLSYCDNSASQLVLGSVLPFGGNEGGQGSLARAEEEGDQSGEYLQPSRDLLAETLTDSVVHFWWHRNFTNLANLGLSGASPPKLELYSEPTKDTEKNATVLGLALQHTAVQEEEFFDKLDLTPPGPDDKVVAKQEPAPAPAGFGGGFQFDAPSAPQTGAPVG